MNTMKFAMLPRVWDTTVKTLEDAGHTFVENLEEADFLFFNGMGKHFPEELPKNIKFVQNAFAGMDSLAESGKLTPDVRWANAAGLYGQTVAESTLGLILALYHQHVAITRAKTWKIRPEVDAGTCWLHNNKTVAIVGAGGIAEALIPMLRPFGVHIIAVNHSGREIESADETYPVSQVDEVWGRADIAVLLMPLTKKTHHMINAEVFKKMKSDAIIVNVGRGPLVNTDDLVAALEAGEIAGAALDVTDPEPLPDGHPLWEMDNVLITPHTANTDERIRTLVGELAAKNAEAFMKDGSLITEVDPEAGY